MNCFQSDLQCSAHYTQSVLSRILANSLHCGYSAPHCVSFVLRIDSSNHVERPDLECAQTYKEKPRYRVIRLHYWTGPNTTKYESILTNSDPSLFSGFETTADLIPILNHTSVCITEKSIFIIALFVKHTEQAKHAIYKPILGIWLSYQTQAFSILPYSLFPIS